MRQPTGAGLLDDEDLREWWADGEEDSPTSRALLEEVLNGRRDNNSIHIFVRANSVSRRLCEWLPRPHARVLTGSFFSLLLSVRTHNSGAFGQG
jgi:hypothetical protein